MSHDQKISSFTNQSLVQGSDLITIVRNGTNFNVTFAGFINSLGVTGTLNPVGSSLGVPTLEQPVAGVNNLRAIESGAGILASVSAENGITVKTDFIQGSAGTELIKNLTDKQLLYRSLVAGDGINIASLGDDIQITAVTSVVSSKTIIISQESDFPVPIAGVITLEPLTRYRLVNDVSTSNRFILQERTIMSGDGPALSKLTYTGSGTMFSWLNAIVTFEQLRIDCPAATVFEGTSPSISLGAFIVERCAVDNCDRIGIFGDMFAMRWSRFNLLNVTTNGILFTGNTQFIVIETSFINELAGTLIDFGTSTFDGFTIDNSVIITSGTAVFIDGLPNSGNVNIGGIGTVVNVRTKGSIGINNINPDNALWQFALNDEIADTRPDGLLSMQGNAINTVIISTGVGVLVAGVWVVEETSQMTGTTGGELTYNGGKDAKLPISGSVTIQPVSGGSQDLGIEVAINGVMIPNSLRVSSTSSGNPVTLDMHWQENLSTGDTVELFVSNQSVTTDVLVSSAILRIN